MQEEVTQIKIDTEIMKKDISQLKEDTKKNGIEMHAGFKDISIKIDNLDDQFSGKWVETCVIWAARIVGSAMLLGLVTIVASAMLR